MQELESLLCSHGRNYPLMEPRDAVKLIYQNEFGGGHLISDEDACLEYLLREYEATKQISDAALLEPIGNGIFRVNLAAMDAHGYTPEALCQDFIRSAGMTRGTMDSFLKKLSLLQQLTRDGKMPFSPEALDTYLGAYQAAGCPPVSHSERYRIAYHPAYRVLRKDCLSISIPENPA